MITLLMGIAAAVCVFAIFFGCVGLFAAGRAGSLAGSDAATGPISVTAAGVLGLVTLLVVSVARW